MKTLNDLLIDLDQRKLYISIRENTAKKHTPYNFRTGYTNLLGVTLFRLDQIEQLKQNIIDSVDNTKNKFSMQIINRETKKIVFKYSNY